MSGLESSSSFIGPRWTVIGLSNVTSVRFTGTSNGGLLPTILVTTVGPFVGCINGIFNDILIILFYSS